MVFIYNMNEKIKNQTFYQQKFIIIMEDPKGKTYIHK